MIATGGNPEAALPPHNLEAEQALLGRLLADSHSAWPIIGLQLKPSYFHEPVHGRLFEAISSLASTGKIASPITIKNAFDQDGTLAEIGGMQYLAQLVANAPTLVSSRDYADLLRELAARRSAIAAARELIAEASVVMPDEPFGSAVATHIEGMQRLFDDRKDRPTTFTIGEAMLASVDRVRRMQAGEADRNTVKTEIAGLDRFTGGLHRGEYVVLGGRPSMGKTACAIQLAYNVAKLGGGVLYASLEMPVALLTPRFASCRLWGPHITVPYQSIIRGEVDERTTRWLESATEEFKTWPLIIDDAARLDCPVLALAQLNRGVEARDDKRPQLADLRESGSIEQDADAVIFVYRPAYYLERKRCSDPNAEADRLADLRDLDHQLELIVEKQRSGPIGTIDLWCDMAANVVRDPADVQVNMEMAA